MNFFQNYLEKLGLSIFPKLPWIVSKTSWKFRPPQYFQVVSKFFQVVLETFHALKMLLGQRYSSIKTLYRIGSPITFCGCPAQGFVLRFKFGYFYAYRILILIRNTIPTQGPYADLKHRSADITWISIVPRVETKMHFSIFANMRKSC
jgi:hypothetical protein